MREFKRKRGYLTIAQQGAHGDYLRMAYGLALSLRATQSKVPHLAVCIDKETSVPKKYLEVFDEVVMIPWGDDAKGKTWKIHNKRKSYYITPYEETILLDADMIFPTDVSHWWETLAERNIWFATNPVTYRGEPITRKVYRQEFITNSLPMVYTAFSYFKQSNESTEFFALLGDLFLNWNEMRNYYQYRNTPLEIIDSMKKNRSQDRFMWTNFLQDYPRELSGDLAYAMATKILAKEEAYAPECSFPSFVHMKVGDQGFRNMGYGEDWTEVLSWSLKDDLTLLVENHVQRYPFHYVVKDWLSQDILKKLEKAANG